MTRADFYNKCILTILEMDLSSGIIPQVFNQRVRDGAFIVQLIAKRHINNGYFRWHISDGVFSNSHVMYNRNDELADTSLNTVIEGLVV